MKTCHYSEFKIHFEKQRVFCTTIRINLNSKYTIIKNFLHRVRITMWPRIRIDFFFIYSFFEMNFLSSDNYVHYSECVSLNPMTLMVIIYQLFFLCRLMWFQVIRYRIYFKQSSMKFIFLSSVVIWIKFCRCHLIYTKTFRLMKYCTVKQILDNFKLIENLFLIHCIILVQNNAVYKPQKHTLWFDLHRFKCNLYERFLLAQKLM